MKFFKKGLALLIAIVMTLSLTACGDTSWVYKYEDTTISSGVYLAYLIDGYYNIITEEGLDAETDIFKQTLDSGADVEDEIIKTADESIKKALYSKKELEKLGFELNDDFYAYTDAQAQVYWSRLSDVYLANGVGEDSYNEFSRLTSLSKEYFLRLYSEGGEKEIPKQDLLDYYSEYYCAFKVIAANLLTEETAEENADIDIANAAIKARIDGYVTELNNGADFDTVLAKEREAAGKEAPTEPAEPSVSHKYSLSTTYSNEFAAQVESLEIGEAAAATIGDQYVAVLKCELEVSDETTGFLKNKQDMMMHLKSDEFDNWLLNQSADLDVTVNDSAVKHYSPKKFDL